MAPKESETEEFARRLREIRDGSGRSYGALARRVGVSASTLHRYCSGSTVPLEFAPVERLARLCGCAGDDLTALHRLWVRADAERNRRQEAATGAAAAGQGAAAATQDAGPTDPARTPTSASASASESESESESESGSAENPADAGGPGGPHAPPPEARGGGSAPLRTDPGAGARRSLLRRTGWTAAALVTALLALVFSLAFDRSSPPGDGKEHTTAQEGGDGPGTRAGSASPSRTPSGTTSARAPSGRPTSSGGPESGTRSGGTGQGRPRTGGGEGDGGPGKPAAGPSGAGSTGTPFTWRTDQHVWKGGCGHAYLVKREPSAVPPPPSQADAEPWVRSVGAVHAGDIGVRVTVQGKSATAVVLQALHVRVTARRAPLPYNVYHMNSGCGGALTPRLFDVDLDMPRPVPRSRPGNDSGDPIPAVSFPYKVSATDPEILLTTGRTTACDCDWYLELEWTSGSRSGTVRIDDHGRPFRTSGLRGRPAYAYDTGAHRWITAENTAETRSETRSETDGRAADTPRAEPGASTPPGGASLADASRANTP